jgi:hypothetical protein
MTAIKLKINRQIFELLHSFLEYSIPHIMVKDIASLCAVESLEALQQKLERLRYAHRKSYTLHLSLVAANSLCGILYAMKGAGDYEGVIATELAEEIEKQIERAIRMRMAGRNTEL